MAKLFTLLLQSSQRGHTIVSGYLQWSNCLVYLNDVVIVGRTFTEHLQNLQSVFDRLTEAGLKLQTAKCSLCRKQVKFLGHIASL